MRNKARQAVRILLLEVAFQALQLACFGLSQLTTLDVKATLLKLYVGLYLPRRCAQFLINSV